MLIRNISSPPQPRWAPPCVPNNLVGTPPDDQLLYNLLQTKPTSFRYCLLLLVTYHHQTRNFKICLLERDINNLIGNVWFSSPIASKYCLFWPITYRRKFKSFKTCLLGRGFHTPTNIRSHNKLLRWLSGRRCQESKFWSL